MINEYELTLFVREDEEEALVQKYQRVISRKHIHSEKSEH